MKILRHIVLVIALTTTSIAQPGWQWLNPHPVGSDLNAVVFIDANTATCVGDLGVIMRTTDGGATWREQESGVSDTLVAVDFVDVDNGWAIGERTILHTTNGGAAWTQQVNPDSTLLNCLDFVDASVGFAAGGDGNVLRTLDGGTTWTRYQTGLTVELNAVSFVDAEFGWVAGARNTILRTTDGGNTWLLQLGGTGVALIGLAAIDPATVWTMQSQGTMYRTTDSGASWTSVSAGLVSEASAITFIDRQHGLSAGRRTLRATTDGGATWTRRQTTFTYRGISMLNANDAIAVGSTGSIARTTDGGVTWSLKSSGTHHHLRGVYFNNSWKGVIVGAIVDSGAAMRRTTDAGETWVQYIVGGHPPLHAIHFVGARGWAVGAGGGFFVTFDGGDNWVTRGSVVTTNLNAVEFANDSVGWSVGDGGLVLRTTNAGREWSKRMWIDPQIDFRGISVSDVNTGTIVGTRAAIYRTIDGGETWNQQAILVPVDINDVEFIDANNGWIAGGVDIGQGFIRRTTDGGATWTIQADGLPHALRAIDFSDHNNGTAVGDQGLIVHTTDAGATWTTQRQRTHNRLWSVQFIDNNEGWIVGDFGTVLHTKSGGFPLGIPIDHACKAASTLVLRSIPNPFSASTTITFVLSKPGDVVVSIHDYLGREVSTIVSEHRDAGEHSVVWNAEGVSDGVYYVRVQSSDEVVCRSMIRVR